MIVFGTRATLPDQACIYSVCKKRFVAYNLSSMFEFGERLSALLPPYIQLNEEIMTNQREFDELYGNYIITDPIAFYQVMRLMYSIYEDSELLIYILIDRDDYRDMITESLIKFIQQRYGYNCNLINEMDDWIYISDSEMNIYGLYNFDMDKEKYISIMGTLIPGSVPLESGGE